MKILILDDEKQLCDALLEFISMLGGHKVTALSDSRLAIDTIREKNIELLITDVRMPYLTGVELVAEINRLALPVTVILISGQEDVIRSINALDLGVFDFVTKPVDVENIARLIDQIQQARAPGNTDFREWAGRETIRWNDFRPPAGAVIFSRITGDVVICSVLMRGILKKIRKIAPLPEIPVLVEGKTGTGKEIVARLIHAESSCSEYPFIAINCAAIDKNLFESELFGYEKGAFTGADPRGKIGKIGLAEGGTLFLDEITEISPDLQSKLLRLLQEKEYYPVGSNRKYVMKTRIICATNRNIRKMIARGQFREDLYYRLDVCKISVPPLSRHRDDVIPLVMLMGREICLKNSLPVLGVRGEVLGFLMDQTWPGNIRQLRNTLTKALLFCEEEYLGKGDFDFSTGKGGEKLTPLDPVRFRLPGEGFNLDDYVSGIILKTLVRFNGNKTRAARFLGLDRFQFYRRYRHVVQAYEETGGRAKSPGLNVRNDT